MKKYLKKISALLIAIAMVVAMCIPASAANTKPVETDTATATVSGINVSGVKVTAYKIIDANYNTEGFTGYSWSSWTGLSKAMFDANGQLTLTDTEITALAEKDGKPDGTLMSETSAGSGVYTASLKAGAYMVLVTGSNTTVYNPVLIGIGYSKDGSGSSNTLSQTDAVTAADSWTLETSGAYVKSSDVSIKKTIDDAAKSKGNDVAVGDTIPYVITTKIPSYSSEYSTVKFDITDTLTAGLTNQEDVTVTVAGVAVTAGTDTFTVTYDSAQKMVISFASNYIKAHGTKDVVVKYSAKVNSSATFNYVANTNTVTLDYTNAPGEDKGSVKDTTYHYTFALDASLNGATDRITKELLKTGETITKPDGTTTDALNGATFTLTNDDTTKVYTAVSGQGGVDGDIQFTGLDAGTYTLKETVAPSGYQLSTVTHKVTISAEYNTDGTLNSYTVNVDGANGATSTYTNAGDTVITDITGSSSTTNVPNTKLSSLPSTGGIGTYIFTIAGVVIMVVAAAMYFSRKKHSVQ